MAAVIFNAHDSTFNVSSLNSVVKEVFFWRKKKARLFCSWNLGRHDIITPWYHEADNRKTWDTENFSNQTSKQLSSQLCRYGWQQNDTKDRVAPRTARQPEENGDTRSISKRRQNSCTYRKTLLLWSRLFFLLIVYNSKQFPLLSCLDCLIVILLSYKLILTWLIQSQILPAPDMVTMRLYFHFVPSPGLELSPNWVHKCKCAE